MEYALRLVAPRVPEGDPRSWCRSAPPGALPDGPVRALYFGAEFCEDRLPDAAEAEAFCALALARGWAATLLTPIVTEGGLGRVERLLARLERGGHRPEVVFNDWGVLSLVAARFPSLRVRAGRLLNRGLRDPRACAPGMGVAWRRAPDAARGARMRGLVAGRGATAVETDPDLDGGWLGDGAEGLERALHLPYAFASSGRNCLVKAAAAPGRGVSDLLADGCARPCHGARPLEVLREDCALPLWRAGNTLFWEVPWDVVSGHLAQADRVVLHEAPSP